MQEYPVKRGMTSDLGSRMVDALRECFDAEVRTAGDHYQIRYGALKLLDVSVGKTGKTLIVHTESDSGSSDEVILDTNRRFRRYLDITTGYTTKERVKKAKAVEKED
ncbi:MAG TPA: DUF5611 family protein [Methanoregulaceae archaeon]|nr:MAG: DUF5611 family protein [Methanolinea sp.]HON81519.1 DUF5611 family protein [Methanoregulaceae archaeon]HPD10325.1 DUF5611 family protein [Methanoregulaceae archaeon]HRT15445.1 DUF5611 family protein [Methanoregulaceae archaeon]HRU30918.1 DUF5611 family protein [Methanoregulaceae archaeon]